MSHNIHIFLTNQDNDLGGAMLTIDNTLVNDMPDSCDYFRVLGAIDLNTGEYKEWQHSVGSNWSKIVSKSDLEAFANRLYSKEQYERYKTELERLIKLELWFNAKCMCEQLDGIRYAQSLGFPKWSADPDKAFAINDGYYYMSGISDWKDMDASGLNHVYAVIVDFHS